MVHMANEKRIKHTVSNPYHLWAHQVQDWAKNANGNRSFEGTRAYSYRAVIGCIVESAKGERVYLLSSDSSWSVTTSKHQSELWSAIPYEARELHLFRVPNMASSGSDLNAHWHRANAQHLVDQAHGLFNQAKRSMGQRIARLTEGLNYLEQAHRYAKLFKVAGTKWPKPAYLSSLEALRPEWAAKDAVWQDNADARDAARREARRLAWEKWQADAPGRALAKAKRWELMELEAAERRAKSLEHLEAWLNEGGPLVFASYDLEYPRLRLKGDTVETTMRATVPADHVRRAMPIVLAYIAKGREFRPNGETIRLGDFQVSLIDAEGTVTVGCHRFPKAEILRFAAVLGIAVA